jgi:uncharacterized protein
MTILLDTNVLIAALIASGLCSELLEHCLRCRYRLISSQALVHEFEDVLIRKFRYSKTETRVTSRLIFSRMELVEPLQIKEDACTDVDDLIVLGTACAGQCQYIVSGDSDLLTLKEYEDVRIVSPRSYWQIVHDDS